MSFSIQQLAQLIPGNPNTREWFDSFSKYFPEAEINTTERISAFIAECSVESANFTTLKENLNYSGDALFRIWKSHFPTMEIANEYARKPELIANRAYANRMGNGGEETGDGWKFRGKGLIQLTGKNNHMAFAEYANMDIDDVGEYLLTTDGATQSACWFWKKNKLNSYLEKQGIDKVSRVINGGDHGLIERRTKYQFALHIVNCN
jgi:putative chitinase